MKTRAPFFFLLLFLWSTPAFSQGCAMCRSTAAAASQGGQRAINTGVLILLLPPIGVMTLGIRLALRYGKKRDLEPS